MNIDSNALPIHANATADIRPRLFLEGSYYIDLQPGTPSAPALGSGQTLPAANTTGPVQLDRVLSALNSNTRANLQTLLRGFGGALDGKPTPAQDATQDPTQRGLTAGQSLNESLNYAYKAFQASSIVNEALLGQQPHDLSGVVVGLDHTFSGLSASQAHLAHLITSFNATMGALAARQDDSQSDDRAAAADAARDRQRARADPGVVRADTRVRERADAEHQATRADDRRRASRGSPSRRRCSRPRSCAACSPSLTPAIQGTASTLNSSKALLSGSDELARCFIHNIDSDRQSEDLMTRPLTTGLQVYQELFQSAVGLASVGPELRRQRPLRAGRRRRRRRPGSDRPARDRRVRCSATRSCRRSARARPIPERHRRSAATFPASGTRSRT